SVARYGPNGLSARPAYATETIQILSLKPSYTVPHPIANRQKKHQNRQKGALYLPPDVAIPTASASAMRPSPGHKKGLPPASAHSTRHSPRYNLPYHRRLPSLPQSHHRLPDFLLSDSQPYFMG